MWAVSSTNPINGRMEMPTSCQRKGCKGAFIGNIFPLCEEFTEPKTQERKDGVLASIAECRKG
jgi:hypothetical protein